MKLFLAIAFIVGGYMYILTTTTNIVLNQTKQLNNTYQQVEKYSDSIDNETASN